MVALPSTATFPGTAATETVFAGIGATERLKLAAAAFAKASVTVISTLAVPGTVGVPAMEYTEPETVSVSPAGKPVAVH